MFDSLDRGSLEIEAQIETAFELLSADAIANHPRVSSLAFTAHAFGETVLDGPCVSLDGLSEVLEQSEVARDLGCDCKWVILPGQTIEEWRGAL
jgi:citrate lyase beta subunit